MPQTGSSRPVVFVLGIVVTILAASWLWWWPEAAPVGTPAQPPPIAVGARQEAAVPDAGTDPLRAAVSPPAVESPVLQVRGRCLAAETGQPLQVVLHVGEDDGAAEQVGGVETRALATGASGDDGRFELALPFAGQKDLRLLATAVDRAPMRCRREAAQAGQVWDVGEVRMPRAARVHGEVVDATGEPVAEAEVLFAMPGVEQPRMAFADSHTALTNARGRFAMSSPMAVGDWFVAVDGTGALRTPRQTQVPASGEHFVRIEVERPDGKQAITGKVVDRTGLPLAGVAMSAYGEGARGRGRSGADGTFLLHRGPPHFDRGKSGVEVTAQKAQLEQVRPPDGQWVAWGQRDVVIVMQPLAAIVVRAIDERGAPVWPFELLHGQISTVSAVWIDYAASKCQPVVGGVQLTGLRSGPHVLLLRPQDPTLALAGPLPFVVDEALGRELTVRVPDRIDLQVEVVDGAGTPVPRCELDLLVGLSKAPVDVALPAPRLAGLRSSGLRGARQVSLASATTDERGLATMIAPPGRYTLHARCSTHLPHTSEVVVTRNEPRLRIVLDAAAVLHGRLVPVEALAALGFGDSRPDRRLAVVARAATTSPPAGRARADLARAEVAADGTFTLGPLGPGMTALRLQGWLVCNDVHAGSIQHSLGELDTTGMRTIEREFPVGAFVPATVTGIVLLDGQPMADAQFFLRRLQPEPRLYVRVATGKDGRFRTAMPPGVLGVQLALPSQPGPGHVILPLPGQWTIGAGETKEWRIEGKARRLRLLLRDAEGKPLGNRRVRVESRDGYNRPGSLTTDSGGTVEIDPAPYGEFTVHVQNDPGPELSRPVQAPDTEGPATLEVRMGG